MPGYLHTDTLLQDAWVLQELTGYNPGETETSLAGAVSQSFSQGSCL